MTEDMQGKTTVSPEVLTTIASLAALEVTGVSRLAPVSGGVNRLFRRGQSDGVRIEAKDNVVYVDLFLILKDGVNIREVGRNVQQNVARSIQEMVGMEAGEVNVHVEDIDFEGDEA
ncbi:MAG: Asp23/Gls24 family envelope stress response protein [Anaerolineales bacterium]|nr:MAG: Asp23/Gls24 family envelope stress response protein [Chloroflexota bacterium]MBE7432391.1 Asp23/Gls24 family envelope stress response protein [Anaerolineales bacterium]MCE7860687.1 Asp23/Gls24 family envelope stress response protein [Chloroflexi bacterium CFX2]MCK6582176.1 Asp23/Gls24 family envelope stress response protein [Anaerolineales bacterium]